MAVNTVQEQVIVTCPNPPMYAAAKVFLQTRFPAGNPEGYTCVYNDVLRTITISRNYVGWEPLGL